MNYARNARAIHWYFIAWNSGAAGRAAEGKAAATSLSGPRLPSSSLPPCDLCVGLVDLTFSRCVPLPCHGTTYELTIGTTRLCMHVSVPCFGLLLFQVWTKGGLWTCIVGRCLCWKKSSVRRRCMERSKYGLRKVSLQLMPLSDFWKKWIIHAWIFPFRMHVSALLTATAEFSINFCSKMGEL